MLCPASKLPSEGDNGGEGESGEKKEEIEEVKNGASEKVTRVELYLVTVK